MKLPDGDVLIHCGDATGLGSLNEFVDFNRWMSEQPHKYKIFVAGNHDWLAYRDHGLATQILQDVMSYRDWETDRKSTCLNSSHRSLSRMPSSA